MMWSVSAGSAVSASRNSRSADIRLKDGNVREVELDVYGEIGVRGGLLLIGL